MEKKYLKEAKDAIKSKNYADGLSACLAALSVNPNNVTALVISASAYKQLGKPQEAVENLERAVALEPSQPTAWQGLASLIENTDEKKDLDRLVAVYTKLIELLKEDDLKVSDFLGRLLRVQLSLEGFEELITTAQKRIELLKKLDRQESLQETYKYLCKGLLSGKDLAGEDLSLVKESFKGGRCFEDLSLCSQYARLLESKEDWTALQDLLSLEGTAPGTWKNMYICRLFLEKVAWNLNVEISEEEVAKASEDCDVSGYKLACRAAISFKAKNYVIARDLLTEGLSRENFQSVKEILYQTLVALGDWPRCISLSKSAIDGQQNSQWTVRYALGVIYNEEDKVSQGQSVNKETVKKVLTLCEKTPDNAGSSVEAICHILLSNPSQALQTLKLKPLPFVDLERSIAHVKIWVAKGELHKAKSLCEEILEHFDDWRVWLALGKLQVEEEDLKGGTELLKKALKLNPESWEAFYCLAQTRIPAGDFASALKMLRVAQKYRPASKKIFEAAVGVAEKMGDVRSEVDVLEAYCEKAPDFGAWLRLGVRKIEAEDGSGAVLALQNALRLNPKDPPLWSLLGEAYMIRGSYATALKALQKAAEIDPSPLPLCLQGRTHLALGEPEEAEKVFRKGMERLEETEESQHFQIAFIEGLAESQYEIARSAIDASRIGRAIEYLRYSYASASSLVEQDASLVLAWVGLAKCAHLLGTLGTTLELENLADSGKKMDAAAVAVCCWKKALELNPTCAVLSRNLALSYLGLAESLPEADKMAKIEMAIESAKNSLVLGSESTDNWIALGLAASKKGDFALSQHSYIKALNIDNRNAEAWIGLGVVYLRSDNMALAHKAFGQAQKVDPGYEPSWVGEGIVAESVRPDIAMDMFEHALSIGGSDCAVRGYGEWVLKFLKKGKDITSHVKYALEQLHALSVAGEHFDKMEERGCLDLWSWNTHGLLLERHGFPKRARKAFETAAELALENGSSQAKDAVFANLARCHLKGGQFDDAIANFGMVGEASAFTTCALGLAQHLGGYEEEAYTTFEGALGWLAENPSEVSAIKNAMAKIKYKAGDVDAAVALLKESADADLSSTTPLCDLISIHVLKSRLSEIQEPVTALRQRINDRQPTAKECLIWAAAVDKLGLPVASSRGLKHMLPGNMWSHRTPYRNPVCDDSYQKPISQYASTPHLFVYQPTEVEPDESESGYGASSSSGRSNTTPEPIYSTSIDCKQSRNLIRRVSVHSMKNLAESMRNLSVFQEQDEGIGQGFVTEKELMRVETFFRGNKTEVFVCRTLANLYRGKSEPSHRYGSQSDLLDCGSAPAWELCYTGIPVLLLDTGLTKSRSKRRIQIMLAERATGFTLWSDTIDNLSSYSALDNTFHTMRLSTDHRQMIGFSFDDAKHACDFHRKLQVLTADPANICLSVPKLSKKLVKATPTPKPAKFRPPKKSDISQPCFFQHVTNIDVRDQTRLYSLQSHLPTKY